MHFILFVETEENQNYPTLLAMGSHRIRGYTAETLIAEKLHTMFRHGARNSLVKYIYDIWLLSRQFDFLGDRLSEAIKKIFTNRQMKLKDMDYFIFSDDFKTDKKLIQQWNAFVDKNTLSVTPKDFIEATDQIHQFIVSILEIFQTIKSFDDKWHSPGSWVKFS